MGFPSRMGRQYRVTDRRSGNDAPMTSCSTTSSAQDAARPVQPALLEDGDVPRAQRARSTARAVAVNSVPAVEGGVFEDRACHPRRRHGCGRFLRDRAILDGAYPEPRFGGAAARRWRGSSPLGRRNNMRDHRALVALDASLSRRGSADRHPRSPRPRTRPISATSRENALRQGAGGGPAGREADLAHSGPSLEPLQEHAGYQPFIGRHTPLYRRTTSSSAPSSGSASCRRSRCSATATPWPHWFERCLDLQAALGRAVPRRR